jgi:hypothetical protein
VVAAPAAAAATDTGEDDVCACCLFSFIVMYIAVMLANTFVCFSFKKDCFSFKRRK